MTTKQIKQVTSYHKHLILPYTGYYPYPVIMTYLRFMREIEMIDTLKLFSPVLTLQYCVITTVYCISATNKFILATEMLTMK